MRIRIEKTSCSVKSATVWSVAGRDSRNMMHFEELAVQESYEELAAPLITADLNVGRLRKSNELEQNLKTRDGV